MSNWGILGSSFGAQSFSHALSGLRGSRLVGLCAPDDEGDRHFLSGIAAKVYDSYEDFLLESDIELVYVAAGLRKAQSRIHALMDCGKGVVYEPLLGEHLRLAPIQKKSKTKSMLLLEGVELAMLPSIRRIQEVIQGGSLGELLMLQIDASKHIRYDPQHPFYKEKQGGIFRQHGRHPLLLFVLLFGSPDSIHGDIQRMFEGVEEQYALVLRHASSYGVLTASGTLTGPMEAHVIGSEMRMQLEAPFYGETRIMLYKGNRNSGLIKLNYVAPLTSYLIHEAERCQLEGLAESPHWSHQHSTTLLALVDRCRAAATYYEELP